MICVQIFFIIDKNILEGLSDEERQNYGDRFREKLKGRIKNIHYGTACSECGRRVRFDLVDGVKLMASGHRCKYPDGHPEIVTYLDVPSGEILDLWMMSVFCTYRGIFKDFLMDTILKESSFWIPRLRKWGFKPVRRNAVKDAAGGMYPYDRFLEKSHNNFFYLTILNIINSEMVDADDSLKYIREKPMGIPPRFYLSYYPKGFSEDSLDIWWDLQMAHLREIFLFLESLSKPERLALCINIDWAKPIVEYFLKVGI